MGSQAPPNKHFFCQPLSLLFIAFPSLGTSLRLSVRGCGAGEEVSAFLGPCEWEEEETEQKMCGLERTEGACEKAVSPRIGRGLLTCSPPHLLSRHIQVQPWGYRERWGSWQSVPLGWWWFLRMSREPWCRSQKSWCNLRHFTTISIAQSYCSHSIYYG